MIVTISNELLISGAPESFYRELRDKLSFPNPQWKANDKMNRWNGNTPRMLSFFHATGNGLAVPRGFTGQLVEMAKRAGISYHIEDNRRILPEVEFSFAGILKGYQQKVVKDILNRDFNVLQAPTGSGKTIMAMAVIAERQQSALIIVHNKELLNQWIDRIETFLRIPRVEVGQIGDGKKKIGEKITIGIINSIYPIAEVIKNHFGHIVIDECHRCASRTFTEAVTAFDCKYMLGLSATPYRRDGLTKLIGWHLGRQVVVKDSNLTEKDRIQNVEVITRETGFNPYCDASEEYTKMLSELTEDNDRNRLIVADVVREASNGGGACLVLSDRKSHCEDIRSMLSDSGIKADVLTGDTGNKERGAIVERLSAGTVRVLIATGQLIGEGFDAKSLQTLFLATPIKFSGRLIQYLGRIMRPSPGKDYARVYDYIDTNVGVLRAAAKARQKVYHHNK